MLEDDSAVEIALRGLSWQNEGEKRTLIYNLTVPLLKNNVDLCLFNLSPAELETTQYKSAQSYIALGEIKGGVDPAGADEHWKTARTALDRIHKTFSATGESPYTFFVGAAIEKRMASEIWELLEKGILANAANLNVSSQTASICRWLCLL